ncbi:hypothetical protein Micbo1qcDRAFT_172749 [Microdochium bolleyi]|uniref:Pleiotrophin/Midkine N-terminal domain-containing protein n=1 Tax=Microdochium bolleyi TaxID=196109 RepID=A0A136J9N1_9PEZI|nr:hypothetical protein Micbo1qcDRAFT_172749 [Microdochium bolleyi]
MVFPLPALLQADDAAVLGLLLDTRLGSTCNAVLAEEGEVVSPEEEMEQSYHTGPNDKVDINKHNSKCKTVKYRACIESDKDCEKGCRDNWTELDIVLERAKKTTLFKKVDDIVDAMIVLIAVVKNMARTQRIKSRSRSGERMNGSASSRASFTCRCAVPKMETGKLSDDGNHHARPRRYPGVGVVSHLRRQPPSRNPTKSRKTWGENKHLTMPNRPGLDRNWGVNYRKYGADDDGQAQVGISAARTSLGQAVVLPPPSRAGQLGQGGRARERLRRLLLGGELLSRLLCRVSVAEN